MTKGTFSGNIKVRFVNILIQLQFALQAGCESYKLLLSQTAPTCYESASHKFGPGRTKI